MNKERTPAHPESRTGPLLVAVRDVRHWTERLFSFSVERPRSFRFRSGEFVMLGLPVAGQDKPIMRAYSMTSPEWDDELAFFSIKIPDGPLTSRLQKISAGETLLLGRKPTGTLVLDALKPGRTLYLLSTGTGIAPFLSLIRDPRSYDRYERIILSHTCRHRPDLAYGIEKMRALADDPLIGTMAGRVTHHTSLTRDPHTVTGRITTLIDTGQLFRDAGTPPLDPACDRAMICGSTAMIADTGERMQAAGLSEGHDSRPGEYVIEKAFAN